MIFALVPLLLAFQAPSPEGPLAETAGADLAGTRAHYLRVETELLGRDVSHLSPELRAARIDVLEEFRRYRQAQDFTRWHEPGVRVPVFVDADGRHCAVANLLRYTGESELVARVARDANHAWVANLAGDADFESWLSRTGLTFEEAARIQGPAVPVGAFGPNVSTAGPGEVPTSIPTGWESPSGSGSGTGPNTPAPTSPDTPAPSPRTPVPSPGTPGAGPGAPVTGPGSDVPPTYADTPFNDWMLWWEFNKLQWFDLRPLAAGPISGDGLGADPLVVARNAARPLLRAELHSPNASVRAAAAVAYGRAAGARAIEDLKPLLEDPARQVRLAALAGLAASASEQGVHALLEVVGAKDDPGHGLRAAAVVALGAARAEGFGKGVESLLPALLRDHGDDEAFALLTLPRLAAEARVDAEAKTRSGLFLKRGERSREAPAVRARATGALRGVKQADLLPRLLDAVGGRSLEQRRAAALTLGSVEGAREPLMTAFELEKEPLARGFLLTSIGRQGGEQARDFIAHQLEHGPRAVRPWAALALGILADEDEDDEARRILREAYGDEKNRASRGAYLLALGIARDDQAEELLVEALDAGDASTRSYAAQALGRVGGPVSHEALRRALLTEVTPITRSAMAQALAQRGDDVDAGILLEELTRASDPIVRMQLAVAVGSHGSPAAVEGLLERLEQRRLTGEARAAAISGLAIALSGRERLTLADASADSNHTVFPGWFVEVLQQPL